ncbi:MAG: helicase related protein [Myxococcales bacterium]|nr:helicase related protein [Myxococcales bacterium]
MIDQVRERVEGWKSSLLDLTAGNRLLDAKDGATCLPLPGVDPVAFAATLAEGAAFAFEAGCDPAVDRGWLRIPLPTKDLERRLVTIRRTALADLADAGDHTLWLAMGLLTWCEHDGTPHTAPLALWPVELERAAGGGMRLVAADGIAPSLNHLLAEKLRREFDLVLAVPGAPDDPTTAAADAPLDLAGLLDAAEGIAVTRPGWHVERGARLGLFSVSDLALWQDLEQRGDAVLASPVIAHLAAPTGPFAQPSIAAAEAVTRPRAASDVLAPLDADASQLAAVAAAAAGATFVVHGAPGTGKSQTIANLIAHCISHGKTVLFVSNKMTALDIVQQRLTAVGLGEFCLELHSHKASPELVLAKLGRVLDRSFRPGTGPAGDDARLAELRSALDAHVAALHMVGPFGRSLHAVLGRLTELRTTPRAALAERDAVGLDGATFDRRRTAVEVLAAAAIPVEPVATHPWRASTMERTASSVELDVRERALAALDEMAESVAALNVAVREVATLVPGFVGRTREQLQALGVLAALAAASPRPGAELLTHIRSGRGDEIAERIALIRARGTGTIEVPRDPMTFLVLAHKHRGLASEVEARFTEAVADLDAPVVWAQLRKWTGSMGPLRYVALRNARAEIRAAAQVGELGSDDAMITALESVIAERACRAALLAAAEPAKRWFGDLGGDPLALDLERLDAAVGWAAELRKAFDATDVIGGEQGRQAAWRSLVAQVAAGPAGSNDSAMFARLFTPLADAVTRWIPALARLADAVGIDPQTLSAGDDHLAALRERVETLRHAIDSLGDWVTFHSARRSALSAGVGPAVAAIERGDLGAAELAASWERATLLAWADAELAETPALARFHGAAHHAQVSAFADLDRGALALARARALVRLAERVPRGVKPHDPTSGDTSGELAILMQELKKQTGRRSVRQLFSDLRTVLPRLAPCLMMSPLAAAQLLDAAHPAFDVVVLDEASQLPMSSALGALSRGTSAVIVGDARQLRAIESVFDASLAAKLPELRLTWHYRSKHEDLIAFANQRYYADRLQVFPTAQGSPDLGISWRRVEGVLDREGTRQNLVEAEAVVADALARLRDPSQRTRSIAIVTLSPEQQELIEDLLDAARRADPSLDALIEPPTDAAAMVEPLLVKHVGTVQGDERDVVLLSIGYAPDAGGVLTMDLGPLSQPGGERSLDVAITRAREQLLVFSSFAPEDLHDDAPTGVRDLAALLAFARGNGGAARPADDAYPASPITAAIARALNERGWSVRHQVGCGAYKVDLAVVDPNDNDRYVLAIEHDGAAYASATAARDRDRLRPQVLTQLGWRLHRIWGLDWWADPEREIQRAHGAIVTAIAASRQRRAPVAPTKPRLGRITGQLASGSAPVVRIPPKQNSGEIILAAGSGPTEATPLTALEGNTTPTRIARNMIAIGPYTAAAIPNGRRTPDDLFSPRHLAELGKVVEQVLAAEAPMHVDLLARRVGGYFGIGRVTQRVTDQVRIALSGRGRWGEEANVVWRLDQDPGSVPAVRVAGHGPTARREIDEVPLSELASAARIVVERASGISATDLVRDSARLLGFARITETVTTRVTQGVQLAIARELIRVSDGKALLVLD